MIGRTLDHGLSIAQDIRDEISASKDDESLLYLIADILRAAVLPIERKRIDYKEDEQGRAIKDEEGKLIPDSLDEPHECYLDSRGWDHSEHGYLKRECAKAFEKRKKVKVGDSFEIIGYSPGYFSCMKKYPVIRIGRNTVKYKDHIISSNKKELIKNAYHTEDPHKQITPVHYKWVLW